MTPPAFLTTITFTGLSMLGMALVLLAAGDWLAEQWNPFTAATHASPGVPGTKPIATVAGVGRDLGYE